ncbi:ribonuclease T2 family protein [Caulobacter sp. NIBR2454]|uniref:ribonuclease T2 family protein n=1 Tax=Caulobacter sp. NIBR2454 TaxID=3015996 RepID=UPI0022B65832|nr:ribonuclease T [Caulobacter sp. NIBR2454]
MSLHRSLAALAALPVLAFAGAALADSCAVPANLAPAPAYVPPAEEVVRDQPVAHNLLALSWAPEWKRSNPPEHGARHGDFGFTLHGLWPNGAGKRHPRYCADAGPIDAETVRGMYCRMPSPGLLQHEWAAHGTCGWTSPADYFAVAARLYDSVKTPRLEQIPADQLTAGRVRSEFTALNPWLKREMIVVRIDGERRLGDVRLCYDLKFQPEACPGGLGAADDVLLRLTPSLSGRF